MTKLDTTSMSDESLVRDEVDPDRRRPAAHVDDDRLRVGRDQEADGRREDDASAATVMTASCARGWRQ